MYKLLCNSANLFLILQSGVMPKTIAALAPYELFFCVYKNGRAKRIYIKKKSGCSLYLKPHPEKNILVNMPYSADSPKVSKLLSGSSIENSFCPHGLIPRVPLG